MLLQYRIINNSFSFMQKRDQKYILSGMLLRKQFGVKCSFFLGIGKMVSKRFKQLYNYIYNVVFDWIDFLFYRNLKFFEFFIDVGNVLSIRKIYQLMSVIY